MSKLKKINRKIIEYISYSVIRANNTVKARIIWTNDRLNVVFAIFDTIDGICNM